MVTYPPHPFQILRPSAEGLRMTMPLRRRGECGKLGLEVMKILHEMDIL